MGNGKIKIDAFSVSKHARTMSQKNANLSHRGEKCGVNGGSTNFKGYTEGIECMKDYASILAELTKKISEDCNNIRYAASEFNGLDVEISRKIEGIGSNISK